MRLLGWLLAAAVAAGSHAETYTRGAVATDRVNNAGPCRHTVDHDRASAANSMLTAEMNTRQPVLLTKEIGQCRSWLDGRRNYFLVDS